jgi:hypothetical protein
MLYSRINSCARASSSHVDLAMRQSDDPVFAKDCAIDTPMPLLALVMTTTGSLRFVVVEFVVLNMTYFPAMRGRLNCLFGNDVFG